MRVVITGGGGQLAADLRRAFADGEVTSLSRGELNICSVEGLQGMIDRHRPDVVLNTAAFHNVDLCESEPEQSFAVNAAALQRLAALCDRHGTLLVHYSTDYVFDGAASTPYLEDHPVHPINVYGASKAAGEMALRATAQHHLIIRTTGLYGWAGLATGRGNFIETMMRLGTTREVVTVVADQVLTPTFTLDLAATTRALVDGGARGTVHVTNAGQCSWHEFAAAIFRTANLPARLEATTQGQWQAPAPRPAYSVLAHEALHSAGIQELRPWQEALAEYMAGREALLSNV